MNVKVAIFSVLYETKLFEVIIEAFSIIPTVILNSSCSIEKSSCLEIICDEPSLQDLERMMLTGNVSSSLGGLITLSIVIENRFFW